MERSVLLTTGAVGIAVAAPVTVVVVPGAIADPTDDGLVHPGPVGVVGVSIAAGQAAGETATLEIGTRTDRRGNPMQNASVLVCAVNAESGLLTMTQELDVGTLLKNGETAMTTNLTAPRGGGYDIKIVLYSGSRRVSETRENVRGVSAIKPPYLQSTTLFTGSEALPPVPLTIAETGGDRTTLDLTVVLTNADDDPAEDLSVLFVFRQAESNVVASRTTADAGITETGWTEAVDASVSVLNDYSYHIDAVLLRDGAVIDTARGVVNSNPARMISASQTREDVELRAENLGSGDGDDTSRGAAYEPTETISPAPGFGPLVAVMGLLVAVLVVRRWSK